MLDANFRQRQPWAEDRMCTVHTTMCRENGNMETLPRNFCPQTDVSASSIRQSVTDVLRCSHREIITTLRGLSWHYKWSFKMVVSTQKTTLRPLSYVCL